MSRRRNMRAAVRVSVRRAPRIFEHLAFNSPTAMPIDDYEILESIGSGSYGECRKIRRKRDGRLLVWKEMEYGAMTETEKQMLVSEVNLLRELRHRHIVRYHDRLIDRQRYVLYIIMEFCEGGDLSAIIGQHKREHRAIDESFVWKMCVQLASALQVCHTRSKNGRGAVLHRDLKPANIFLDSNRNAKLGDFGLARVLNPDNAFARTFVGTPYYMSPEQVNYLTYNEKSDIWSLGCLLYELCALRPPFIASNQKELAVKISKGVFQRIPQQYSEELNDLIKLLLQVDEFRRPSIDQVLDHPVVQRRGAEYLQVLQRSSSPADRTILKDDSQREMEEVLRLREESIKEKEQLLRARDEYVRLREAKIAEKEKELEKREAALVLREKLIEERLQRFERPMERKRVSFNVRDKENDPPLPKQRQTSFRLPVQVTKTTEFDLKTRLRNARLKADELRQLESEARQKAQNTFGIR